jgi:hypothetical protein
MLQMERTDLLRKVLWRPAVRATGGAYSYYTLII